VAVFSDFKVLMLENYQGADAIDLLGAVFRQLYGSQYQQPSRQDLAAWAKKVRWRLADSLIDSQGRARIDLTEVAEVEVIHEPWATFLSEESSVPLGSLKDLQVFLSQAKDPKDVKGVVVRTNVPPPVVVARVLGCCFFVRPPRAAARVAENLKRVELSKDSVRIMSLVHDTSTEERFLSTGLSSRLARYDIEKLNAETVRGILRRSAGQTLVVVGHVEQGRYVARSADGLREIFSMDVATLRTMAKEEHVQLVDIGCRTGAELDKELSSVGVINKFNSVAAVDRIAKGLSEADNLAGFFESMAGPDLLIVGDRSVGETNGAQLSGALFTKPTLTGTIARIGHVALQTIEVDLVSWFRDMVVRTKSQLFGD
jgi:hypothetical protein